MPNIIDSTGLTVKTISEIINTITAGMQNIYGADINIDSNSPDGQMINLFAQAVVDNLEVLQDAYNQMSVELAYGTQLDNLVAINGIAREAGTYTTTPVSITTDRAVTLTGLDALLINPNAQVYQVQDINGVLWDLVTTYSFASADTQSLTFRCHNIGRVECAVNTITQQGTIILGVTAVNNPSISGQVIGLDEETDAQLKTRRASMFFLASISPADAVEAALRNVSSVTDAYVVENDTDGTVNSVPAHSIYCIVNGGASADIANAIYAKKAPGCGMYGSESYVVSRPNGSSFTAYWDNAVSEDLYITMGLTSRVPGVTFDNDYIKTQLASKLIYKLGQNPNIGDIIIAMAEIEPRAIVSAPGVSRTAGSYTDIVTPTAALNYFFLTSAHITIS